MFPKTIRNAKLTRGAEIELAAERWLHRQGLTSIDKNFRCKAGEIDLIMRDGAQLVFVEVRFRQCNDFGSAVESVTHAKQQRVIRAAQLFIATRPQLQQCACRFDVIGASLSANGDIQWQWLRDAFVTG